MFTDRIDNEKAINGEKTENNKDKPRIWSLADVATSSNPPSSSTARIQLGNSWSTYGLTKLRLPSNFHRPMEGGNSVNGKRFFLIIHLTLFLKNLCKQCRNNVILLIQFFINLTIFQLNHYK